MKAEKVSLHEGRKGLSIEKVYNQQQPNFKATAIHF